MFRDDHRDRRTDAYPSPRYGTPYEMGPQRSYGEDRSWGDRGPTHEMDRREFDRGRLDRRDDGGRDRGGFDYGWADRRFSREDARRRLPREETGRLIASDKVEGTAVFDRDGRRIGHVQNFMVEKRSGQVAYAVVRIRGGFVSGEDYRPVDWNELRYDERLDGYRIDFEKRDLRRDRAFDGRR